MADNNEPSLQDQIISELSEGLQNDVNGTQPPATLPATPPATPPVTPPATPPVEPPAATEATEPPATGEAAPAKEWYEEDEPAGTAAAPAAPATGTQPASQTQPPADPLYDKYKSVINKPEVQFLLDQVAAGKSIFDVQKEITIIDYDNLPAAEVLKMDLEKYGATADDIADKLEDFNKLKPYEQAKEVASLRAQGKQEQAQRMAAMNQTAQQSQAEAQKFQQQLDNEIQAQITAFKGKVMFGHVVTDEAISKAIPMVRDGRPNWKNPDGTPNVAQFMEDMIFLNERNAIVRTNVKNAQQKGAKEVAAEVTNASKGIPAGSANLNVSQSIEEVAAQIDQRYDKN